MERKYPAKMFWLFVLTNLLFHFFYLFVPALVLCIIGIWKRVCLWTGLAILGIDLLLSIIEQMRIREASTTNSDNPEFNELMDAFCGPGGLEAFGKLADEKNKLSGTHKNQEDKG